MSLCLIDLAELTGGRLHFGPLPPRDGEWTIIRQIAFDSRRVEPGDVFWRLTGYPVQTLCGPQHALFRGALGVVAANSLPAPWPGSFCLEVDDEIEALLRLAEALDAGAAEPARGAEFLQVLQLQGSAGAGITPATCGQSTGKRIRCRGRAA
ncbi:MAG: hypothetical protein SFU86_11655 [Pirellulaceae bacterium]|nr:hypothetical protein [Pirellulaceae bacterium]